jgi:hypothetical protein
MTLQNSYKKTLTINPPLPIFYTDDTTFAHVFVIPSNQLTLNLSTANKADTRTESTPENVDNYTLDLQGTIQLVATAISVIPNPNATIYYADMTTNAVIFDYIINPRSNKNLLKLGDTFNNGIITKVVNLFDKYSYFEYTGTATFTVNQVITVNGIQVIILAGKGILDRAGVVGKYSTDYKNISYYAKFTPNLPTNSDSVSNFSNYDLKLPNPYTEQNNTKYVDNSQIVPISTPNNRLSTANSILSTANSHISSIADLNGATFVKNDSPVDGISNIDNPIVVTSWLDIPIKTNIVGFGVSNITPKNNDFTYVSPSFGAITIKFNRFYSPIPITNPPATTLNSRVIDGWLLHTYNYTTTVTPNIDPQVPDDITYSAPPSIRYNKDANNYVNFVGYTNNTTTNVLFAGNDVVYETTTHVLDYDIEPYGSSNVTNLRDIQNQIDISTKYSFGAEKIKLVNDIGGNYEYPTPAITTMTTDLLIGQRVINVVDTSEFMSSGYLQLNKFNVTFTTSGSNEIRNYEYVGSEIVYYSMKTLTSFWIDANTQYSYEEIGSNEINNWFAEVVQIFPFI